MKSILKHFLLFILFFFQTNFFAEVSCQKCQNYPSYVTRLYNTLKNKISDTNKKIKIALIAIPSTTRRNTKKTIAQGIIATEYFISKIVQEMRIITQKTADTFKNISDWARDTIIA